MEKFNIILKEESGQMSNQIKQGDIVIINFDPSQGAEIQKRRPALVLSRNEYNQKNRFIIVCPVTSTEVSRPYLIPIENEGLKRNSKVNVQQVYSFDCTKDGDRKVEVIGHLNKKSFFMVAQAFMFSFNFFS